MKINIFIKKSKQTSEMQKALQEYYKRISPFCKLKLIEFTKSSDFSNKISSSEYIILVHKTFNLISSPDLAEKIKTITLYGNSTINMVLLQDDVDFPLAHNDNFAISKLSLSYSLENLILTEQLYRAFTIINGKTYHK